MAPRKYSFTSFPRRGLKIRYPEDSAETVDRAKRALAEATVGQLVIAERHIGRFQCPPRILYNTNAANR